MSYLSINNVLYYAKEHQVYIIKISDLGKKKLLYRYQGGNT